MEAPPKECTLCRDSGYNPALCESLITDILHAAVWDEPFSIQPLTNCLQIHNSTGHRGMPASRFSTLDIWRYRASLVWTSLSTLASSVADDDDRWRVVCLMLSVNVADANCVSVVCISPTCWSAFRPPWAVAAHVLRRPTGRPECRPAVMPTSAHHGSCFMPLNALATLPFSIGSQRPPT